MESEKIFDLTVQGISPSEVVKLETLFKLLAEDNGGINEEQLADLMPRMGAFYSEEELHTLFRSVDIDNSGEIDFHEFLMLIARHREESQLALLEGGRECFEHLLRATALKYVLRSDDLISGVMDMLSLLSILFFACVVLYEDILQENLPHSEPFKCVVAVYMLIDIARSMHTAGIPDQTDTLPADNRTTCRRQYFTSKRFIIDVVSALPIDIVMMFLGQDLYMRIFQNVRIVKFLAYNSLFRLTPRDVLSPVYAKFYFVVVPLCKMCFWAVISVHTLSMIWIVLAKNASESVADGVAVASYRYIDAIYFVVYTITTTGYGSVPVVTRWQKIFSIVLFICASIVTGLVVGKLVQFSQQADLQADSARRMLETTAALDHLTIPRDFKEEVLAFQLHLLKHSNSLFNDAIAGLPQCMQDRMALYARMKIVRKVPIFQKAPEICVAKLAQSLVTVFVSPEEYIVIAGEEGEEMFFLFHGMCCVTQASGKWVATIKRGGVFGEKALLEATRRSSSIKSLTYCHLFRLDKTAFTIIVQLFPQLMDSVIEVATTHCTARQPELMASSPDGKTSTSRRKSKFSSDASCRRGGGRNESENGTHPRGEVGGEDDESTDLSSTRSPRSPEQVNGAGGEKPRSSSSGGASISSHQSDLEAFRSSILNMDVGLGSSVRSNTSPIIPRRKRGSVASTRITKTRSVKASSHNIDFGASLNAAHERSRRLSFPEDRTVVANVFASKLEALFGDVKTMQTELRERCCDVPQNRLQNVLACSGESSTPPVHTGIVAAISAQRLSLPPLAPMPPGTADDAPLR